MTTGENVRENGRDGLFFLSEIQDPRELDMAELALWLGRGAFSGMDQEQRFAAQQQIIELRTRVNGAEVLAQAS